MQDLIIDGEKMKRKNDKLYKIKYNQMYSWLKYSKLTKFWEQELNIKMQGKLYLKLKMVVIG